MKNKWLLLLLFLLFLFYISYSQTIIDQYNLITNANFSDIEKEKKIDSLLKPHIHDENLSTLFYQFSKWNWRSNPTNVSNAIFYAELTHSFFKNGKINDTILIKKVLFNLGYFYKRKEYPDFDKSLTYFNRLLSFLNQEDVLTAKTYKEMGDVFDKKGDFHKALIFFKRAEEIFNFQNEKRLLLNTYIDAQSTLVNFKNEDNFKEFLSYRNKINVLNNHIFFSTKQKIIINLNNGAFYSKKPQQSTSKSINYYLKALSLAQKIKDTNLIFKLLNNIGVVYKNDSILRKATYYFNKSLKYSKNKNIFISAVKSNFGDVFSQKKEFIKALHSYNDAISLLIGKPFHYSEIKQETYSDIEFSPNKKDILNNLIAQIQVLLTYYSDSKDSNILSIVETIINLADKVIDNLFFESVEENSKIYWRKQASEFYHLAVFVCEQQRSLEKAFYYIEKSKGIMLLLEKNQQTFSKEEDSLVFLLNQKERNYKIHIKKLQNKYLVTKENQIELQKEIFQAKQNYLLFLDTLKKQFPSIYFLKQKIKIPSFNQVQSQINSDNIVVEYMVTNNLIYGLFFSSNFVELKKIKATHSTMNKIKTYYELAQKPFITLEDKENFKKTASELFTILFPFKNINKLQQFKTLTVVTEKNISLIPFEPLMLLNNNELSYLIEQIDVKYSISLSIDFLIRKSQTKPTNKKVAFKISNFSNNKLSKLVSQREEQLLKSNFNPYVFKNEYATKSNFLKKYQNTNIAYISTHAGVKDEIPWLAFYDTYLYLPELYFTKNHNDLIVLSACKTASGEYFQGEGLMTLTRGFIKTGSKSVISSLWNVNEKSSSFILDKFFFYLNQDYTKSQAISQAKRDFISQNLYTSYSSPYYWSPIVFFGLDDKIIFDESLKESIKQEYFFLVLGLFSLLMLFFLIRKRLP